MADIRFKSKPQVTTPAGTEAIPCQRNDNTDAWLSINTLSASIRAGMVAQSGTANRLYGTGPTSGQQALLAYDINASNNAMALRNGDGTLLAKKPDDTGTASADTLVNKTWFEEVMASEAQYNTNNYVQRTTVPLQVYGTDENGNWTEYPVEELGGGGGGVPPTNTANRVYGTDSSGEQAVFPLSVNPTVNSVPKRDASGAVLVATPEDWLGSGDDAVSRAFFGRARQDRIGHATTEDETGFYEMLDDADGLIVDGPDIAEYEIRLPPVSDYAKHLTIRFNQVIEDITWAGPATVNFTFPSSNAGDVLNLCYDPFGSAWFIKARNLGPVVDATDYWTPNDLVTPPKVLIDADEPLGLLTMGATNGSRQITAAASRFNAATYPMVGSADCILTRKDHRFEGLRSITCSGGTAVLQLTGTASNGLCNAKNAFTMGGLFAYLTDTGSSGTQTPFIYVGTPTADSLRLSIGRASNELNGLRYGSRRLDGDTATSYDAAGNLGTTPFFAWMRVNFVTGVVELWVNGALIHTGATPTSGGASSATQSAFVGLGASSSSGSNQCPIACRMAMFEDSWVADSVLRQIEGYYAHRDKMPDILVPGHIYRSTRPVA